MLRTGQEHLESLRDGRIVYIGSERVERHDPSCVPQRRRDRCRHLRHEGGPG
jgi:hypothetical protein